MHNSQRGSVRRALAVGLAVASVCVIATGRMPSTSASPARVAAPNSHPNVLLLVADDQTGSTFDRTVMPHVFSQLVDQGVLFDRTYVDTSLCCPSRAQMFTGLNATDSGVAKNLDVLTRPNIVQAFHDQGYRTLLAGKYLNSQPCRYEDLSQFDEAYCYGRGHSAEKNPYIDVNGRETKFTGYAPDILGNYVQHFIDTTPADEPFFAIYSPKDPHLPADDDRFDNLPVPKYRPPSFDEDTEHDGKPQYMQRGPLRKAEIAHLDSNYADMYRSSRGLDDAVGNILTALGPRADNTIVVYISDNGFMYGEHRRVAEKIVPYEESVRVPMVVRDPMVHSTSNPAVSQALVENIDIAPTIAAQAGIDWHADGQSLLPLLSGTAQQVRDSVLLEYCQARAGTACWTKGHGSSAAPDINGGGVPAFVGVVTSDAKYVEYATGEKELYDLADDPYELVNHAGDRRWAAREQSLSKQLRALRDGTPLDTTIVTGPSGIVAPGSQTFTYFAPARTARYRCRLSSDAGSGKWTGCDGQATTVGPLSPGHYVFSVAATVGKRDKSPARRAFTVSASVPAVSVNDVRVKESAPAAKRAARFKITLDRPAAGPVSVDYRTDDGTAQSPDDFAATSGTVKFAAGATTAIVSVPVVDDSVHESPETFELRVYQPDGVTIGDGSGTGTILDDDRAPAVSVGGASVVEGDGPGTELRFPVRLSAPSGTPIVVRFRTVAGTAAEGQDYTTTGGTVTFAAGQTEADADVAVVGDAQPEPNQTMSLRLESAGDARLASTSAVGTIRDDDPAPPAAPLIAGPLLAGTRPTVSLERGPVVTEGNSGVRDATFTVRVSRRVNREIAIAYATHDGSAIANTDYRPTSGTVVVPAGATRALVRVPVFGDALDEPDEHFTLTLSNPVDATLAPSTSSATATIANDDWAPTVALLDDAIVSGRDGRAVFQVGLTAPSGRPVTVDYATSDVEQDRTAARGSFVIPAGTTTSTFAVPVVGGPQVARDGRFLVQFTGATNAELAADDYGAYGLIRHVDETVAIAASSARIVDAARPSTGAGGVRHF
ncbi:MAG TPA: Calx-beta domain-containing protein [Acidimicrobiia bacterium]|nr:Calx-beta domain-containing protein [Acidimicrobiia bacterium]